MSNPPNPIPQSSTGRRTFARHVAPFAPVALALAMNTVPHNTSSTAPQPAAATSSAAPAFVESCPSPAFPTDVAANIDEEPCSVAGSGGAETWQNEAKNNFCAADPAQPITIPDMLQLQTQVQQDSTIPFGNSHSHPLTSTAGPAKDRSHLVAMGEGRKVVLQGFVKLARQEGEESVNCGKTVPDQPQYHDIHISIVQSLDDSECSGVVVEMVPHHRPSGWTAANVEEVANAHSAVRVTGQLMFDSSHTPCINGVANQGDPARASLWEVHPIYQFDVCTQASCDSGTGWVPLEAWKRP
jgi:hypothetical protein